MLKSIIVGLLFVSSLYAHEYKVVYNLTTDKESTVKSSIIKGITDLKEHYKSQGDSLSAVVVISGGSYGFFKKDSSKIKESLDVLVKSGVKFEVCSAGMRKRNIASDAMLPFVKLAFNRTAALIEWQGEGYSLINVD